MQITAIILTGGKSSRMGADKALLELEGDTLLTRAVSLCSKFCDEILISSNAEEHRIGPYRLVADEVKDCGPMGGIYSCLKESSNDWNFVLSVDAPFVIRDFVEFLVSQTSDYDAVIPVHSGKKEPLIALYNKNMVDELKMQLDSGNYKMQFFLNSLRTNLLDSEEWLKNVPNLFQNLNYPEDLSSNIRI